MKKLLLSFGLLAAICGAPTSSQAAAFNPALGFHYFLGMINPQSWDGPHWWGLRTAVEHLAVSHTATREIRSDRAGYSAVELTFTLVNTGRETAGTSALSLSLGDPQPWYPWWPERFRVEVVDWLVGDATRTPALAPGQSAELSIVVYKSDRALPAEAGVPTVSLEITAL